MNRKQFLLFGFVLLLAVFFVTGCGGVETAVSASEDHESEVADTHMEDDEHTEDDHEAEEHDGVMHLHVDPPHEFEDFANPFADDHETLEAGEAIFQTNCAACHGEIGMGDGPAAENLEPKPATLADGEMMGMLSDGYLYWRVSKGGMMEPFNSAMPSWEAALTEDQRWQVITFVRSLSGEVAHMDDDHKDDEHMEDDHMDDNHEEDDHSE